MGDLAKKSKIKWASKEIYVTCSEDVQTRTSWGRELFYKLNISPIFSNSIISSMDSIYILFFVFVFSLGHSHTLLPPPFSKS